MAWAAKPLGEVLSSDGGQRWDPRATAMVSPAAPGTGTWGVGTLQEGAGEKRGLRAGGA